MASSTKSGTEEHDAGGEGQAKSASRAACYTDGVMWMQATPSEHANSKALFLADKKGTPGRQIICRIYDN